MEIRRTTKADAESVWRIWEEVVREGDALRLQRSWTVKTFTKGLELFKLIADLAEAEGIFKIVFVF